LGGGERYSTITGKSHRTQVIDLGHWKYVTCTGTFLILFFAAILPLLILLWSSFLPYYVPSFNLVSQLSWDNYKQILDYPLAFTAFKNSVYLSVWSAPLVMFLTSVIAWITVRSKVRGRGILDTMAFLPIAIPGIVLGMSLMWVYLTLPIPIYGTIWILLFAYMTKYMPYGMRISSSSMIQVDKELEEASMVSGAGWPTTFWKIFLPLLMPGFMAGWIFISVLAFRELSVSILLYSYKSTVTSIFALSLWEAGEYTEACALGILMITVSTIIVGVTCGAARMLGVKMRIAE